MTRYDPPSSKSPNMRPQRTDAPPSPSSTQSINPFTELDDVEVDVHDNTLLLEYEHRERDYGQDMEISGQSSKAPSIRRQFVNDNAKDQHNFVDLPPPPYEEDCSIQTNSTHVPHLPPKPRYIRKSINTIRLMLPPYAADDLISQCEDGTCLIVLRSEDDVDILHEVCEGVILSDCFRIHIRGIFTNGKGDKRHKLRAEHFAKILPLVRDMREVRFERHILDWDSVRLIIEMITSNFSYLEVLDMWDCRLNSEMAVYVAKEVMSKCPFLRFLNLGENDLDGEAKRELRNLMQEHSQVKVEWF